MISRFLAQVSNMSLRWKIAIMLIIPLMAVMLLFSIFHYVNESKIIEQQIELMAIQLGDLLLGSMRHGMMINDQDMLRNALVDITVNKTITRVWVVDLNGEVKISSRREEEGSFWQLDSLGCAECHRYPAEKRPNLTMAVPGSSDLMRVATPIQNLPECWACHPATNKHLGILLIDATLVDSEKHILNDLKNSLLFSLLVSALVGVSAYWLVNQMLVLRIEALHKTLKGYSEGQFDMRAPDDGRKYDEVAILGRMFNQMADKLAEHEAQLEERARVREMAIVEERERIARELHDGIAQFLSYLITKAQAARLLVERGNFEKADDYMYQMEDEARKQAIDVRASILGLKMFTGKRTGLANDIRKYLHQSNRFMDIEVTFVVDDELSDLMLEADSELQILRIIQEAISNVRKHSQAHGANVSLEFVEGGFARLTIHDDGVGFDVNSVGEKGQPHFGLATMRERAHAIGATFTVESGNGSGTTIVVTIKLPEKTA
jgi:signal transduction histidine kinase